MARLENQMIARAEANKQFQVQEAHAEVWAIKFDTQR